MKDDLTVIAEDDSEHKKPSKLEHTRGKHASKGVDFTRMDKLSKKSISVNDEGNLDDEEDHKKMPKHTDFGKVSKTKKTRLKIRLPKDDMSIRRTHHLAILDIDLDDEADELKGFVKNKTNKELTKL